MKFLKKLLLAFVIAGTIVFLVLIWLINFRPVFKPCEPFETRYGSDTLLFPIEGTDAKLKFGGMKYDSLPPFFLYRKKGDTLVMAHFRAGYETGQFNYRGQDTATTFYTKGGYSTNYDVKGIYAYSYTVSDTLYQQTSAILQRAYGDNFQVKTSNFDHISYSLWEIGPCHHLLFFKKKPFSTRHGLDPERFYTYILFVYNLSEKEINDVVERDGGISNEYF
ncbi:MAG: hypothetical protein ABS46_06200 [Cytophagaceae bacterium SCN 52-12]|nr:MAG: hypothetical protein ABS46_06200 [Cytophagaceae bacterium SCN 52-12]